MNWNSNGIPRDRGELQYHYLARVFIRVFILKNDSNLIEFENILHHLNYRWKVEALAQWKGERAPVEAYRIYEGYENFISLNTLARINQVADKGTRTRLRHALIDHYVQRTLLPHEAEMRTWMRGAAASVDGEKIYFHAIIPWCQKSSTYQKRQILQKETGSLCKFLKPFALNYWNILLDILQKDLKFKNYQDYCFQKKGIDYHFYYKLFKRLLQATDELYFTAMDQWARKRFGLPLIKLTRFDAINLMGLGQFDELFPENAMEKFNAFFRSWNIDLESTPGLNLELGMEEGKSAQAISFILEVPAEVYILMRPEGGWVDLETLGHELGHGLSAVFTSPELSIVDRDLATSYCLFESFAFLIQNLALSRPFLEDYLGVKHEDSKELVYHKALKDLAVFRRYAAKFIAEFEMFSGGELSNGEAYARLMARYTGFYYQPESHLFDLVPEFYCLDYLLGWMAEAILESYLNEHLGSGWIFRSEAGHILKKWWQQGNRYDIFTFFDCNHLGSLTPDQLLKRWNRILGS